MFSWKKIHPKSSKNPPTTSNTLQSLSLPIFSPLCMHLLVWRYNNYITIGIPLISCSTVPSAAILPPGRTAPPCTYRTLPTWQSLPWLGSSAVLPLVLSRLSLRREGCYPGRRLVRPRSMRQCPRRRRPSCCLLYAQGLVLAWWANLGRRAG